MHRIPLVLLLAVLMFATVALVGCGTNNQAQPTPGATEVSYEDGTYRGAFLDGGEMQVNVQLKLEDNVVTDIRYRYLYYAGIDYRSDETVEGLKEQYEQAIQFLVGKDIRDNLGELYEPDFVDDVDGFSGATVRANKAISAIRDALNRGVYSF